MSLVRGGIYVAELPNIGHKTVLIVSDDGINIGLKEPIVARITENPRDRSMDTIVELDPDEVEGLTKVSYVLCHDLTTLEESDFVTRLGTLPYGKRAEVDRKLAMCLHLDPIR